MPDIRLALSVDEKGAIKGITATAAGLDDLDKKAKKTADTLSDKLGKGAGREVESAMRGMAGTAGSAGSVLAGLGPAGLAGAAGLGAIVAVGTSITAGLIAATKATITYSDQIGTLRERTDLSVKTLQVLDAIARKSGTSVDTAAKAVANMQAAIVKGDPAFKGLGLNFAEMRKLPPEAALVKVAKAIDNIGDAAGRTAARRDVFGKMGDELGPLLSTLAAGTGDIDRFGLALSDASIKGAKALGDQLTGLDTTWNEFKRQLGDAVVQSGLAQEGIELLTKAIGGLGTWVRDNKDEIIEFFRNLAEWSARAAGTIARAIPGGGAAIQGAQLYGAYRGGRSSAVWDETWGIAPGQWVPGAGAGTPPPKSTYNDPAAMKARAEAERQLAEEVRKLWQAVSDFQLATAQLAQKLNAEFFARLQGIAQQGNLIQGRGQFGVTGLGSYGQQFLSMYTSGLEKELPRGRQIGGTLLGFGTGGAGDATNTLKTAKATVDWNQSLQNLAHTMQLLGGGTNEFTKALGGLLAGLAAAQQVASIMGDRKFGKLKGSEKFGVGVAGLGVAASAYQGGSVLGGAAGGAAFGASFGPWGAAIGGVAGGVLGFFGKAAKERKELEALRGELTATYGSMDKIRSLGAAVGVSMDVAFNTKSPKAAKAAIDAFEKALAKTKDELSSWERGIVSAQARALVLTQPGDKDVQAFVRGQREAGLGGLGAAVKGIKIVTPEDARAQASIVAVNFWDTFKTEGFIKAADAFKGIMSTVTESLAKIGGDEAAAAILGPIQQLVDLGTVNEAFRGAAEGAQGLATNLDSLANRSIPLTASQFSAFEQQAKSAYEQAAAAAIESGMTQQEAQAAAIMATAPLLQSLVQSGQAYNMTLSEGTMELLGMAEASGIAFKTDSTDRLILAINALTTAMGGIPPAFETSTSAGVSFGATTSQTFGQVTGDATALVATMTDTWSGGATEMELRSMALGTELAADFVATADFAKTVFGYMTDDFEGSLKEWKGISEIAVSDVQTALSALPSSVAIPISFSGPVPGTFGFNYNGTPDNDGDKSNSFAAGATNRFFPPRRGGHRLTVSEGGRGEFVTVTNRPLVDRGSAATDATAIEVSGLRREVRNLNESIERLMRAQPKAIRDALLLGRA